MPFHSPLGTAYSRQCSAFIIAALILLFSCHHGLSCASPAGRTAAFFSYERYYVSRGRIARVAYDKKIHYGLEKFAEDYTAGMNFVADGRLKEAEDSLMKARGIWPEYFGTDFLIALIKEDSGDITGAARFYKSYLAKLRSFKQGDYRISGPLMRALSAGEIEDYYTAHTLIESRLADHGIRLSKVRAAAAGSSLVFYIAAIPAFVLLYLLVARKLIPDIKLRHRMKNPPEGFWVCGNCGKATPELSKVCQNCGWPGPS